MKELHAGYISSAVRDVLDRLDPVLDWHAIVESLCHFVIDKDIGCDAAWPGVPSIYNNLISRGLPTLAPLSVERYIADTTGLFDVSELGSTGATGQIFTRLKRPFQQIQPLIGKSLCIYSQGARIDDYPAQVDSNEDVAREREFLVGPLKILLGDAGIQLVARQRPLQTILETAGPEFKNQRVDFCIEFPGSRLSSCRGVIFELDGPEHYEEPQKSLDKRRDAATGQAGWLTCRIPNEDSRKSLQADNDVVEELLKNPYLRILNENKSEPLQADELGQSILNAVIAPLSIARIQKTLLEAIRGGPLSLNAERWSIIIVERDVACAKLATDDFLTWLRGLYDLYEPAATLPTIDLQVVPAWKRQRDPTTRENLDADLLLDVSVLLRHALISPVVDDDLQTLKAKHRVCIRSAYYKSIPRAMSFGETKTLQAPDRAIEKSLRHFLVNIFRKTDFRECQIDIIARALAGRSLIALLPTGAGKSLIYQMAALLQNGIAVVVDPIKSLMKDQVDELRALGIDASAYINSTLTTQERKINTERMQKGHFKFVYISPERLVIKEFRDVLMDLSGGFVGLSVVDEAHCVSEWGHDFRTAYLRCGANLRKYCRNGDRPAPILALTGTASHEVLGDIKRELELERAEVDVITPERMEREELNFRIVPLHPYPRMPVNASDMKKRKQIGQAKQGLLLSALDQIAECYGVDIPTFIREGEVSGLIFCPHRRRVCGVEDIRKRVMTAYPSIGQQIGLYYGSAEDGNIREFDAIHVQDEFKADKLKILVCTKAFGMGINKPNIRFTVHFNMPQSLEAFYQEAGRAGRDRNPSECWLLYAGSAPGKEKERSVDWQLMHSFHLNAFRGQESEEKIILDLLEENRVPGDNATAALSDYVSNVCGINLRVNLFPHVQPRFLYINDSDSSRSIGRIVLGTLVAEQTHHVKDREVTEAVIAWLKNKRPANMPIASWLARVPPSKSEPGLEKMLEALSPDAPNAEINIPFDNGMTADLARILRQSDHNWNETMVTRAHDYAFSEEAFIRHLGSEYYRVTKQSIEFSAGDLSAISYFYPKLRVPTQTFRAVYRLSVLGAIEDYTYDYNARAISASMRHQAPGSYRARLKSYVERYVSRKDAEQITEETRHGMHATELRNCVQSLLGFVYERIASKRLEALNTMERTTQAGIKNPKAFTEQVNLYFDSRYTADLRPFLKEYTPDIVFEYLDEVRGEHAEIAHLLGSCNRLLEENPDNAALRALRAYCYVLTPAYSAQDAQEELEKCLDLFAAQFGWSHTHRYDFLLKLSSYVEAADPDALEPFIMVVLNVHIKWLRQFNEGLKGGPSDARPHGSK